MTRDPGGTAEVHLRAAVESSPSGLLMIDAAGSIVLVNREIERLFGYAREELLGRTVEMLVPERYRGAHPGFRGGFFASPSVRSMGAGRELFGLHKNGREVPIEIGLTPVVTTDGMFVISSIVDITARRRAEQERRDLEEQLRQSQKLEAVGRLAGGIAHDFNNILGVIMGYGEMARAALAMSDHPAAADLEEVTAAATRGKELIERMLRFSRRQEALRRPVDLAGTVRESSRLLRATLPASIEIRVRVERQSALALADPTSIEQVLLNLANNAAQAMPAGGIIEIGLEPFYARDSFVRSHPGLGEGSYLRLSVRDDGTGMSEAVRARAFEPFFTTKPVGEGTGLGLSMVHGILQDHGGTVWIESAEGSGTTVHCLIPAAQAEVAEPASAGSATVLDTGHRVLYVDDEPKLAALGERRLRGLGFEVRAESDPEAALRAFTADPQAFDVVVTDLSMPGLTGLDLARAVTRLRPGLPVVLITGYVDDLPSGTIAEAGVKRVVNKPVTTAELARVVAEVLAGRDRP